MSQELTIGFIGLGLMGTPIVLKLCAAGYPLRVWGRSPDKLRPALEQGAEEALSPKHLAEQCDIVVLCVTDTLAVETVVFGENGIVEGGRSGAVLVDHSTIKPDATRGFANRIEAKCGMQWLDAPVSGGPAGVERGTLVVMAGGNEIAFEKVREMVAAYAARFTLMGPSGAGQSTKLINQTLVAAHVAVVAEATQLALDAGINAKLIPEALAGGRADSVVLQDFMGRMIERDFTPAATISIMLKDLEMVGDLSRETGTATPITRLVTELHRLLVARGLGDVDNSAMIRLYDKNASC
jgi:3-hydroxyisobutyrate dehydrogenase